MILCQQPNLVRIRALLMQNQLVALLLKAELGLELPTPHQATLPALTRLRLLLALKLMLPGLHLLLQGGKALSTHIYPNRTTRINRSWMSQFQACHKKRAPH